MKAWKLFVVLCLAALVTVGAASGAGSDALSQQAKACDDNVAYFRGKIDGVVAWSNTFMIAGAITAALGSALAGFLTKDGLRRGAALVGALGAVITVLPKTLPDKQALQTQLSAAEKHRVLGSKIRNQLGFAQPGESVVEAEKYASARFTDCASVDPPAAAPDLPAPEPRPLSTSLSSSLTAEPLVVGSSAPVPPRPRPFAATRSPSPPPTFVPSPSPPPHEFVPESKPPPRPLPM